MRLKYMANIITIIWDFDKQVYVDYNILRKRHR